MEDEEIKSALESGIPIEVIEGKRKLSDCFSKEVIRAHINGRMEPMNGICEECGEEAVSMSETVCKEHCHHEWEAGEPCLICGANWYEHHADGYIEDN